VKVLGSILNIQLLAIFICLGALGMAVRIIASFSGEAARLRPKLAKADHVLTTIRERVAMRKPAIEKLEIEVEPLRAKELILREYFEQLTQIELEEMRKEAAEQEKLDGKGIRRRGT